MSETEKTRMTLKDALAAKGFKVKDYPNPVCAQARRTVLTDVITGEKHRFSSMADASRFLSGSRWSIRMTLDKKHGQCVERMTDRRVFFVEILDDPKPSPHNNKIRTVPVTVIGPVGNRSMNQKVYHFDTIYAAADFVGYRARWFPIPKTGYTEIRGQGGRLWKVCRESDENETR